MGTEIFFLKTILYSLISDEYVYHSVQFLKKKRRKKRENKKGKTKFLKTFLAISKSNQNDDKTEKGPTKINALVF